MKWTVGLGVGLLFGGSAFAGFVDLSIPLNSNGLSAYATPREAHIQQPGTTDFRRSKNRKPRLLDTVGNGSCEQSSSEVAGSKNAQGRRNGSASRSIQKRDAGKSSAPSTSTSTSSASTGNCPPDGSTGTGTSPESPNSSQPGGAPNNPPGPPIDDNDDEFAPVDQMGLGELDPLLPTINEMGGNGEDGPSAGNGGLLPGIDGSFGPADLAPMHVPESVGVGPISDGIQSNGVPEPATLALLGIGLAGLGFSRRKR